MKYFIQIIKNPLCPIVHVTGPVHFTTTLLSCFLLFPVGMRVLMEPHANKVMDKLQSLLQDSTFHPFSFKPMNCRILSGEEEAAFAWLAVNYLTGYFSGGEFISV